MLDPLYHATLEVSLHESYQTVSLGAVCENDWLNTDVGHMITIFENDAWTCMFTQSWICIVLGILVQYDTMSDLIILLGQCDLYFFVQ